MAEENPTTRIKEALKELCGYNNRTEGGVVGDMYLGSDIFVATIRRPRIIEGEWVDVESNTVDVDELIGMHKNGK